MLSNSRLISFRKLSTHTRPTPVLPEKFIADKYREVHGRVNKY